MLHNAKLSQASNGEWLLQKGKHLVAGHHSSPAKPFVPVNHTQQPPSNPAMLADIDECSSEDRWWPCLTGRIDSSGGHDNPNPTISARSSRRYRRLTFMMLDADVAAVSRSTNSFGWAGIKCHITDIPLAECDYAALEKMKDTLMVRPNRRWAAVRITKFDDSGKPILPKPKPLAFIKSLASPVRKLVVLNKNHSFRLA